MNGEAPLSPTYLTDLRRIVRVAFAAAAPVSADPVPEGTIQERIERIDRWRSTPLVIANPQEPDSDGNAVKVVTPAEYWELALAHRCIVLGPLLDLAAVQPAERRNSENRLLAAYNRYNAVPLPPVMLEAIAVANRESPGGGLLRWMDRALLDIMAADTAESAADCRARWRTSALRHGAAGRWSDRMTAVAELAVDLLVLCRAVRSDVIRATRLRHHYGDSVCLALASLDEAEDLEFESCLLTLTKAPADDPGLTEEARNAMRAFAPDRHPLWRRGVLADAAPPAIVVRDNEVKVVDKRSTVHDNPPKQEPPPCVDPVEMYSRIKRGLEEKIFRQDLVARLAIVGLGHALGVTGQRLLLVGNTASGKSFAAASLGTVMQDLTACAYMSADASDLNATGWRGLSVETVLLALSAQSANMPGTPGAILLLDEMDKIRIYDDATSNSYQKSAEMIASILALAGGQLVTTESGDQIDTSRILILATGAFGGRFSTEPPSSEALVDWGWTPELAGRIPDRVVLPPLARDEAIKLLRDSDRSVARKLGPLLTALDISIEVPDAVLAYVVDKWMRSGTDYRTAAEWLLSAARRRLANALDAERIESIVLAPDDIADSGSR